MITFAKQPISGESSSIFRQARISTAQETMRNTSKFHNNNFLQNQRIKSGDGGNRRGTKERGTISG